MRAPLHTRSHNCAHPHSEASAMFGDRTRGAGEKQGKCPTATVGQPNCNGSSLGAASDGLGLALRTTPRWPPLKPRLRLRELDCARRPLPLKPLPLAPFPPRPDESWSLAFRMRAKTTAFGSRTSPLSSKVLDPLLKPITRKAMSGGSSLRVFSHRDCRRFTWQNRAMSAETSPTGPLPALRERLRTGPLRRGGLPPRGQLADRESL